MDVAQLVEPRIVIPAVVGSNPIVHPTFERPRASIGPLAQLVEQWTLNPLVVSSIPTRPTTRTSRRRSAPRKSAEREPASGGSRMTRTTACRV